MDLVLGLRFILGPTPDVRGASNALHRKNMGIMGIIKAHPGRYVGYTSALMGHLPAMRAIFWSLYLM